MRSALLRALCLAAFAALAFINPAHAADPSRSGAWVNEMDGMDVKKMKGKAFREERCMITEEHSALEAERAQIKIQCMNAKGQERTACEARKMAFKQKREALKERKASMHRKMEGLKKKHGKAKPKAQ